MKIFLDTGIIEEVKKALPLGLIDGVTTNPSLIAKSGRKREEVIKELCDLVAGDISAEVLSIEKGPMFDEAIKLSKIAKNVVIKLPLTADGLTVCGQLTKEKIKTNVTLCFSPLQALLAAKNGATYISPFIGRLDDVGHTGMDLIQEIKTIYQNYDYKTQILAASIRHPWHMKEAALIGADVCTIPLSVLYQCIEHPLTTNGLEKFLQDAKNQK
jgi:transaldolase